MSLGNLQYALIALLGGALAINGIGGTTLGTVATFMTLSKSFNMPISQVSQQLNSIVMALAGAERIFDLMDEEPETDEGNVTLVNAKFDKDDQLIESEEETGIWAWKVPHKEDDGFDYVQLKGEVRFYDVDFGYTPDKIVLHDISLYAEPGQKIAFVGATGAGKTTITNLINGSMILPMARSGMMASISIKSRKQTCVILWALYCRILICLPVRLWITSAMAAWMQRTRNAAPPPSWPTPMSSSATCRMAITPR